MINAPIKVNPNPPHPCICGDLVAHWQCFRSQVCGPFACLVSPVQRHWAFGKGLSDGQVVRA